MNSFKKIKAALRESVWEQEQVIQLRQKFAELDPKSQAIVQLSAIGIAAIVLLALVGTLLSGSLQRKSRITEIEALVQYAKIAAGKIDASRRTGPGGLPGLSGINAAAPLPELLEQISLRASIGRGSIEMVEGDPTVLKLSRVSIRQLTRLFYILENQLPGVEWKKIALDSRNDTQGYLWADIEVRRAGGK